MAEYQVTCVTKPHRDSPHEHITHIGNSFARWTITREEAIRYIESKTAAFYTVDYSTMKKAYVYVVREAGKHPYLRTGADGYYNNNLLALAECRIA